MVFTFTIDGVTLEETSLKAQDVQDITADIKNVQGAVKEKADLGMTDLNALMSQRHRGALIVNWTNPHVGLPTKYSGVYRAPRPAGPLTLANNNLQNWNANFTFLGTAPLNLGNGGVTLGAATTVNVGAPSGSRMLSGASSEDIVLSYLYNFRRPVRTFARYRPH